ncbi:hypothetical protein [Fuchsiella alkaliacetigena]|uniref:hypothetical protein n=1 Tax=Fuchsiella alkaliacetigena TaxID=957042 RepID=UPI00200AC538|nr:hypothetical protein [Fuchsiella alkaliacetigena]MCK8824607.1 hypothetical protein [Fuchsiella alkaliacetigena]
MSIKTKFCFVFLTIVCILLWGISLNAQEVIKGDIVAVNSQGESFLLKSEEGIEEFRITAQTKLIRNQQEVFSLEALKPITEHNFQEAVLKFDAEGELKQVKTGYYARPMQIKEINYDESVLKVLLLDSQEIMKVEAKGDIALKKNNYSTSFDNLQVGEQGLLILGLEQKVKQLKVSSYEH